MHRIASHRIASHRIASHRIASHRIILRTAAVIGAVVLTGQLGFSACPPTTTPPSVTTSQYNLSRTGWNPSETCFDAASWTAPSIQTEYTTVPCTGCANSPVYAQPLYVYHASIGGGTHNIVIIATLDDYVYAYDADSYTPVLYWSKSLINDLGDCGGSGVGTTISMSAGSVPRVGILSTPVINLSASTPTVTVVGGCETSSTT